MINAAIKKGRGPGRARTPLPETPPFRAWCQRMELSQTEAAEIFGYSRGWIGQFDRGTKLIPKVLALAMRGYEADRKPPNVKHVLVFVHDGCLTQLGEEVAAGEGWGLFWNPDTERMEIQRIDNAVTFIDDAAAVSQVRQRAAAGSKLHQLALELHDKQR